MDENKGTIGDTSTNVNKGSLTDFGDELPRKVGPFNRGDIEGVARRCAKRLGIDWDELPAVEKKAKLALGVDILTGKLPVRQLEDHRNNVINTETRTFGLSMLEEFRNSPKWDSDEFTKGYQVNNDPGSTTHDTADQIQQSDR